MGCSRSVHPETFVKTGRFDDEAVPFPVSPGIPVIAGDKIGRMLLPIQKDLAESVRPADIENKNSLEFRHLNDFGSVGSHKLTCATRRFTPCVRFEFVISPIVVERFRPRLVWCLRIR